MRIASLHVHPMKGARGCAVEAARLEPRGLVGDRRWLAVDADDRFITMRECGALARITPRTDDAADAVTLAAEGRAPLRVEAQDGAARRRIAIWRDSVDALDMGDAAAAWLSAALGRPARLVFMDDAAHRATGSAFVEAGPVSFADAYPVLVANSASLADLNDRVAEMEPGAASVVMTRFRPNIVVDGAPAWAEDRWRTLRLGDDDDAPVIELAKPCDRCIVTTLDPETGDRIGREPLRTLKTFRTSADPRVEGVLFGWNARIVRGGAARVGAPVSVAEPRPDGWPLVVDSNA